MKKNASLFRHLFLSKNFIMMLVMLVVIVMAVSAWFSSRTNATASGIQVESKNASGLDVAECIKTYDANGDVLTDGPGDFQRNFSITGKFVFSKDCTGDGMNLIVPDFNVTKDYESVRKLSGKDVNLNVYNALTNTAKSNVEAEKEMERKNLKEMPEYQYLQFEFYVRSKSPELNLTADSILLSGTENSGGVLSDDLDNDDPRRSAYGESTSGGLNRDGLVGAIRVSLIGEACTTANQDLAHINTDGFAPDTARNAPVRQLLWLPRPDIHLNISETKGDITHWSLTTMVTDADYDGKNYQHSYYVPDENGGLTLAEDPDDPIAVVSSGDKTIRSADNSTIKKLGALTPVTSAFTEENGYTNGAINLAVNSDNASVTEQYYLTKYTMKIWIEGTDSEARRAMDGGQFLLKLYFQ